MKVLLVALLVLQGCAAYSVASTTSLVTTDLTLADHLASQLSGDDCRMTNLVRGGYCDVQDPGRRYNRNPL